MKPIKLEIEGLNSFESKQVLDFSELGNGVFGIFGKTGSGKSTILDAITLALYGKVERSKQNIDFVNTNSSKTVVSLEFNIYHSGKDRTYLIRREFAKKKNGKETTASAQLMELDGEDWSMVEEGASKVDAKIFKILGLGVNEFAKCIALPQGEFSAFLKARPAERTDIISNIFDLSKYGEKLMDKVKSKVNEFNVALTGTQASLEMVGYATDDALENAQKSLSDTSSNYESANKTLKDKREELANLSKSFEKKEKLSKLSQRFEELDAQREDMEKLGARLINAQNANEIKSDHEKLEKDIQDEKELSEKIANINETRLQKQGELDKITQDFNDFRTLYETQTVELKSKLARLESLSGFEKELNEYTAQQDKLNEKIKLEQQNLSEKNEQISYLATTLDEVKQQIEKIELFIEANKPDADIATALEQTKGIESEIILIDDFYKRIEALVDQTNEDLKSVQEEYNSAISEEKQIKAKFEQIENSIEVAFEDSDSTSFNKLRSCEKQLDGIKDVEISVKRIDENIAKIDYDSEGRKATISALDEQIDQKQQELNTIEQKIAEKERQISALRENRDELFGEGVINIISNHLQIGDVCPVCSSRVMQRAYNPNVDLKPIESEIEGEERNRNALRFDRDKIFTELMTLRARYEFEKAQIEINQKEISKLKESRVKHFQRFVDNNDRSEENFVKLKSLLENTAQNLENLLNLQSEYRVAEQRVAVNKAQCGAKITLYKNYLESLIDVLYDLQKKKAEREFAIYNANEEHKTLAEYKKQIAEGKNIELEIDNKKQERYNLKDRQAEIQNEISTFEKESAAINTEIEVHKAKLEEVLKNINNLKGKVVESGVPEGVQVSEEVENTNKQIEKLKFDFNDMQIRLESAKDNVNRADNEYNVQSSILIEKRAEIASLKTKVEAEMMKYNFKNDEELEAAFVESGELRKLQNKYNDFNNDYKLVKTQKAEYEKDTILDVDEEKLNLVKAEVDTLSTEVKTLSENVGKVGAEFDRIKSDNEKYHELTQKVKEYTQKYDTAKELASVLKGRALAEYVAEEYLQEITASANQKLALLMDGRYTLKFENKDFFAIDNFNDAELRPVSTLSGGETFLVSLSLALAISDAITSMSARSMDFFFLDEGFGTLDAELCETALDALHRLESQNLNIGIISHVRELEDAIKNKVIVTKTAGGSKIKIEHSL